MYPGDRVRLAPFEDQGEEFGELLGVSSVGIWMVQVDEQYRDEEGDDGLREVGEDQITVVE